MALNVQLTGTGTIGDIAEGWSVNEAATPVSIGDAASSTGSVTFNAKATDDSLLIINNNAVSTVDGLGSISGIVQAVAQNGIGVSVGHNTVLEKYNMDVQVKPVVSGGPKGWFYQLLQSMGMQERVGFLPAVATFGYTFPFDGSPVDLSESLNVDNVFYNAVAPTVNNQRLSIAGDIQGYGYYSEGTPLADWYDLGSPATRFLGSAGGEEFYTQVVSTVDSSTRLFYGYVMTYQGPFEVGNENCVSVDVDGVNDAVYVRNYNAGGINTATTIDISTLDHTQPMLITMHTVYDGLITATTTVYVTDADGTVVSGSNTCFSLGLYYPFYTHMNSPFVGAVNTFKTVTGATPPTTWFDTAIGGEYALLNFTTYTQTYDGPYPATSGIAWELMQQLGAAESFEINVDNADIIIRPIGETNVDITNIVVGASISPSTAFSGSQINVEYSEPQYVDGLLYDAEVNGKIISAKAGESTVELVKGGVDPLTIVQPAYSSTVPTPDGCFSVIDSDGVLLNELQADEFGVKLFADIDVDDPTALRLTFIAPRSEVSVAGGPYEVAYATGTAAANKTPALRLMGTGVNNGNSVIPVMTGVDPSKFSRTTVTTINNPFIVNIEQAIDRGIWAAVKAGSPVVRFTGVIPTRTLTAFGSTAGALFDYANSTYRVTAVTIGAVSTTISAERHVTVADVDALWGSQTVADYDGFWGAYECQDQIIYPYLGA